MAADKEPRAVLKGCEQRRAVHICAELFHRIRELLRLPMPADSGDVQSLSVAGSQVRVAVRAWEVGIEQPAAAVMNDTAAVMNDTPLLTWRRPASVPVRESFWITPSSAGESWPGLPQLRVDELVHVGAPLLVRREGNIDWAAFGDTVHGFLTADRVEDELSARRRRAQRLIAACTSGASVAAESLIAMSGALHAFVKERWPGAIWHRELPIAFVWELELPRDGSMAR